MKRCSFCEWIPIWPWPVRPLAGQCGLGQNTIVGSMTLLLAMRGNIATRSMSGPPFALQLHRTTVKCGATHVVTVVQSHQEEQGPPDIWPHPWRPCGQCLIHNGLTYVFDA